MRISESVTPSILLLFSRREMKKRNRVADEVLEKKKGNKGRGEGEGSGEKRSRRRKSQLQAESLGNSLEIRNVFCKKIFYLENSFTSLE